MSSAEKSTSKGSKSKRVSVWNWIGTLVLLNIPIVGVISAILFIIFAKAQAKRSFCIAWLILCLVCLALICTAFLLLPDLMTQLAELLRGGAAADPAVFLP